MKPAIFFVAALALLASSCDRIKPEELIVPNDNGFRSDLYEVPTFAANTDLTKYILLEEYTGHLCSNCPGAALIATEMASNPQVILMGVHAGVLASTDAEHTADYTTEAGDAWWAQMVGSYLPCGRFNRIEDESEWFPLGGWEAQMDEALSQSTGTADARLQIKYDFVADAGHLNVHVESDFVNDLNGDYRMELYVTESGIVSPQANNSSNGNPAYPSPTAEDYDHEHVFRGSMNGENGKAVASNPVAGTRVVTSYTIPWPVNWVMANSELIAVITDGSTGRILNVTHAEL